MDEEKKSEASGDGPERSGPYVIQEQVQQSHDSQGECYVATNETSGGTALVRKHAAEEGTAPGMAVSAPPKPRIRWRLGLGVVSAVTVCVLLFALVRLSPVSQPPSTPPAPLSPEALTSTETSDFNAWLADTPLQGQPMFGRPLPKEPFEGQKRPPCTRYTEVELVGACWAPHKLNAPCPDELFEHQGECYMPSFSAKPPPSSLGQ